MIESKIFEIRDKGTYIPILAVLMESNDPAENYHLKRFSWSHIYVFKIANGEPVFKWEWEGRRISVIYPHITKHWYELQSGSVIDIQVLLGETTEPATSEMITCPL